MSKLNDITQSLEKNSRIVVAGINKTTDMPDTNHFPTHHHQVEIFIAPRDGMYTAYELQELMMGLVPIESSERCNFLELVGVLRFGQLYFIEEIGTMTIVGDRTITVTDPDVNLEFCFTEDGSRLIENDRVDEPLLRQITLLVYPDVYHAQRAYNGHDVYEVATQRRTQPGRLRRSLFHRSGK